MQQERRGFGERGCGCICTRSKDVAVCCSVLLQCVVAVHISIRCQAMRECFALTKRFLKTFVF